MTYVILKSNFPMNMKQSIIGSRLPSRPISSTYKPRIESWCPRNKYKFSRNWHTVDFSINKHQEILKWCKEQFGPHPVIPDAWCRWHNSRSQTIHFRDEQDYMLFLLRWA
jgi:hypothetical protein